MAKEVKTAKCMLALIHLFVIMIATKPNIIAKSAIKRIFGPLKIKREIA